MNRSGIMCIPKTRLRLITISASTKRLIKHILRFLDSKNAFKFVWLEDWNKKWRTGFLIFSWRFSKMINEDLHRDSDRDLLFRCKRFLMKIT